MISISSFPPVSEVRLTGHLVTVEVARWRFSLFVHTKRALPAPNAARSPESVSVPQQTHHGMLVAWGWFAQRIGLIDQMRQGVQMERKGRTHTPQDVLLTFAAAILSGCEYLQDISHGPHPLDQDRMAALAWDQPRFAHTSTVSRVLTEVDDAVVEQVTQVLEGVSKPFLEEEVAHFLSTQHPLTLCGDLTGLKVSDYSTTYPEATFGFVEGELAKGYQHALVTLQGRRYRLHLAGFHHPGNTVSAECLRELVQAAEARLEIRPRRRVELLQERMRKLEAQRSRQEELLQRHRSRAEKTAKSAERLQAQLTEIVPRIAQLKAAHPPDRPLKPYSKLTQAQCQQRRWRERLSRVQAHHHHAVKMGARSQQRIEALTHQREELFAWLTRLEEDNATHPTPPVMRFLMDSSFATAANVAELIEMGYQVYTTARHGKTSVAFERRLEKPIPWTCLTSRTFGVDLGSQIIGECPYPIRAALLKRVGDKEDRLATMVAYQDHGPPLSLVEWFGVYHQRQTIEAGIKQGKGVFKARHRHVRSSGGIRLQELLALVFCPNFVHWASQWLQSALVPPSGRLSKALGRVKELVRVAANTRAVVLSYPGQRAIIFTSDSAYPGAMLLVDTTKVAFPGSGKSLCAASG